MKYTAENMEVSLPGTWPRAVSLSNTGNELMPWYITLVGGVVNKINHSHLLLPSLNSEHGEQAQHCKSNVVEIQTTS